MAFITVAGEQLIAQKQGAGQPLLIDRFILANIDALGVEPADRIAAIPSVGQIVHDASPTQSGYVNPNQVVYSLHLDTNVGDFNFNWLGIASGNVLVAAVHLPAPQTKTATAGGVTGNNLTRNILLAFSGAQSLTGITVEADTWQIDFTARLWDMDERRRRHMADLYGRQLFFAAGWQLLKTGSTYNLQPGIGMVAGVRIERLSLLPVVIGAFPSAVWLDVSLQGDLSGVTEVVNVVVSGAAQTDYIDGNQRPHYLVKVADVNAAGAVTDTRVVHQIPNDVFSYLTRPATTDYRGLSEKATSAEGITGTDNERYITAAVLKAVINKIFPPGFIGMWSGAVNQVPEGWALCDGLNGRPPMSDRFIVGIGPTYAQGQTGGSDYRYVSDGGNHSHGMDAAGQHGHGITVHNHTLTISQIPPHQHDSAWGESSGVGSPFGIATGGPRTGSGDTDSNNQGWLTSSVGGGQGHNHGASASAEGQHAHAVHAAGIHNHGVDVRPRWYAIAFIVRLNG